MTVLPQLERDLLEAHARLGARRGRMRALVPAGLRSVRVLVAIAVPLIVVAMVVLSVHTRQAIRHSPSAPKRPVPTSKAGAQGSTAMGATFSAFEAAYPAVTNLNACPPAPLPASQTFGGCYGSSITPPYVGSGQCCEFVAVSTTGPPDNRVDGYTQGFPENTSITAAKQAVLALLPHDAVTTAYFLQRDATGHTCTFWNVASRTLGTLFPKDPAGEIGIDLNTKNTQLAFSASNVTQAVLSTTPLDHNASC